MGAGEREPRLHGALAGCRVRAEARDLLLQVAPRVLVDEHQVLLRRAAPGCSGAYGWGRVGCTPTLPLRHAARMQRGRLAPLAAIRLEGAGGAGRHGPARELYANLAEFMVVLRAA